MTHDSRSANSPRENAPDETPTRPADGSRRGDMSCESAGFFDLPDLLISRIVDGAATRADWSAFEEAAAADPVLWRDLACAQREHALLRLEVGAHVERADAVRLPEPAAGGSARTAVSRAPLRERASHNPWTGWLVAAVLALAAAMGWLRPEMVNQPHPSVRTAGWTVENPEEAMEAYLTLGRQQDRVLGEIPERVLLESRPLDGGNRFEVLYVRRFIERAQVDDIMRFTGARDEAGRPVAVPIKVDQPTQPVPQRTSWRG